jgi:hydrogenase maturation protease
MTTATAAPAIRERSIDEAIALLPGAEALPAASLAVPTLAVILACGSMDRGDDGAAIAAVRSLGALPDDVRIREVGQLDVEDILAIPAGAGVVIADTAIGLAPGWVVEIPLAGLAGRDTGVQPRSSHALSIPETVGLATLLRGAPLDGILVAIGGACFGLGEAFSWPVASGIPSFAIAIGDAVQRVRVHAALGTVRH